MFYSTKTYCHNLGLSAAFRQWKAHSHCNKLHGYALEVRMTFGAIHLDDTNWVVDFGSLKSFKGQLEDDFDHKTLVAEDDPELEFFKEAEKRGIMDLTIVPATGCEMFAYYIYGALAVWLVDNGYDGRVGVTAVEVREHGANSAIYTGQE